MNLCFNGSPKAIPDQAVSPDLAEPILCPLGLAQVDVEVPADWPDGVPQPHMCQAGLLPLEGGVPHQEDNLVRPATLQQRDQPVVFDWFIQVKCCLIHLKYFHQLKNKQFFKWFEQEKHYFQYNQNLLIIWLICLINHFFHF